MITGKTKSGFAFSVDESVTNDMEFVDLLADAEMNDGIKMSRVVRRVLGDEQRKALYDHLRDEKGMVAASAVEEEMEDIFEAFGKKGKNS